MAKRQLILVVRERIGGEATLKHPLIVRLEQQVENMDDFVKYPSIGAEERHNVVPIEKGKVDAELHFDHADKIKWPDHLSPTSIGTLAEYPFDYMMEELLKITSDGKSQMADLKTTTGNVAHAVIEELFSPRDENGYAKPEDIAERIKKEYESAYKTILESKGAVLQLSENKFAEQLFHEQLRNCLDTLLKILRENNLKVTGCERHVETNMGLGLPQAMDKDGNIKDRDMIGNIDMTLEDNDHHPVVFDFKWTSWGKGYQNKLTENRSVQLELYRMMLGTELKDDVNRVAYFIMPEGRLYSKEKFEGGQCMQVLPENHDDIVTQLKQAAKYRKEQIGKGIIETNGDFEELQYVKDTKERGLFPLKKTEEGKKESNFFSQYGLFNN